MDGVIQRIFAVISIVSGIAIRAEIGTPVGGLGVGLHFIATTTEWITPILFILFSDLAFNLEYVQGTFLTHLLCGQSRKVWMLKQYVNFYVFVLLQFFITFILVSLVAGAVTGHFGLEGLKDLDPILYNMKTTELARGIGITTLRTLIFASFGVFVTTFLPGLLVVGSIISIGTFFIMANISQDFVHIYNHSKVIYFIVSNIWLENPESFWIVGIVWLVFFVWLSIERVKRIEVPGRGA